MSIVARSSCHPVLAGVVESIWCAEPDTETATRVERILPTCRAQLILSPSPGASLFVGPRTTPATVERRSDRAKYGVSFRAGALEAVFGVCGAETSNTTLPVDAVFALGSLPEQLVELDPNAAIARIESLLLELIRPEWSSSAVHAAEWAIRNGLGAGAVASSLGVDRRTFVPEFRRIVGVGPKYYERICRFNRSIEAIRGASAAPLASIAREFGFADQAHLTREVNHFADITPALIHRDSTTAINHINTDKIFKT